MISSEFVYDRLSEAGIHFFAGVPDSLLKSFCALLGERVPGRNHVIAANEGAAIALALGYYLSTSRTPLVYLQNSGLGNAVNPLLSLAAPEVYSIPMLLLIGWRGEPGVADEPQHLKQGQVTLPLLDALDIPWVVLGGNEIEATRQIAAQARIAQRDSRACALVVSKGILDDHGPAPAKRPEYTCTREQAIQRIVDHLSDRDIVVSTTGMASRELFEYRTDRGQSHGQDFLTVGGMGHACQIALAIAMQKPDRRVVCIDGDGAALMHLGSMAIIGCSNAANFRHIIVNNGAHDSVGGQPTVGFGVDFPGIARACNYDYTDAVRNLESLDMAVEKFLVATGPALLEIRVTGGNRKDLGRPTEPAIDNRNHFMKFVQE